MRGGEAERRAFPTSRTLIEVALEVGYTSLSHFAQVFRRAIGPGDLFVTRSRTPYEVRFSSPVGEEIENIQIHIAVEPAFPQ